MVEQKNATVGGTKNTLINYNTVEGGYNVGGIVGSISNTTVANASNEAVVKANGFTTDYYIYHTDYTGNSWQNNNGALQGTHKAEVRAANVGGIVGSSSAGSIGIYRTTASSECNGGWRTQSEWGGKKCIRSAAKSDPGKGTGMPVLYHSV